ncbi:hypothetical protein ISR92_03090 [Patescibacteria group bacterium]|nr:hypothetical protein [Patescibacteria group bacterium]
MLAKKKPSKQKNMIMIIILIICFAAMGYMLLGQGAVVEYTEGSESDLLSSDFMQVRKTRKIDDILKSLDMKFTDYDIYKRMKGGVSLPVVEDDDIGNDKPFQVKEFIPERF